MTTADGDRDGDEQHATSTPTPTTTDATTPRLPYARHERLQRQRPARPTLP